MKNRESLYPGRIKLTPVDAANGIYDLVRADEPQEEGTPLNKALLDYAVAACGVTAGTATALTLDDAFGGFTLVDGAKVNFRLHVASGANPTLNVNGTGAKALKTNAQGDMPSGVAAGTWIEARYSSLLDCFLISGAQADITAGEYLGDGSGVMRMSIRATITSVGSFKIESTDPRRIILPFAPSAVALYVEGASSISYLYKGTGIIADVSMKIAAFPEEGSGTANTSTANTNTSIANLNENVLELLSGVEITSVDQNSTSYVRTEVSDVKFTAFSDSAIKTAGGVNVTGKKYRYMAF